jgi:ATP-binding cassette, subfamily B, bacterial
LKYRRTLDYKRFAVASKESSASMQLIQGMQEIKLNNAEHLKRWEWEGLQASLFKLNFKSLSLNQYQQAGAFFINQGKNIFITYLVAISVLEGQLTLGAMLAIQYIIGQLNSPVEQLISFSQNAQDAKISLERLNEIHQLEDEENKELQYGNVISDNHSIQLKNLTFTYQGAGNKPVLSDLSMEFPSGKITAIVGMSGSGKTTILKLIQKFYENYQGEIKIGESNLKYLSPYYWRTMSGSVMQDGYIFSDSIEKNIAVGDETHDYKNLLHACKVANILSFVESLPLGFNTKIGAEGIGISTGQKQRILIARAVYKNPKFILFDEATNALDASNEKTIMENLEGFFKGRTVIIVAHRLSTVKNADKIVVLENGKIIEEGNHKELAEKKGKYYELVKNQLELGT